MIAVGLLARLALIGVLAIASPPHVVVTAPTHTPKINSHWNYTLSATVAGKPAAGTITVQIVDPIGGVHSVEFGANTKLIIKIPFKGTFRDYMIFPPSSREIPLKIRFTLHFGSLTKIVSVLVTPGG